MSDYLISQILHTDKRGMRQMDALLKQEGIEQDKNLDYTAGLFDDDYNLVAVGSCFQNTLRCLAVDSAHQGEGLLNQVITHLTIYQHQRGNINLFLYTKCDKAKFFHDLGFYEVARVDGKVVFMENRRTGFADYLKNLEKETSLQLPKSDHENNSEFSGNCGAVIMNANPFTLGHQYLLETAASQCDILHVFVVSEDVSLVPFSVRSRLVRQGSTHLKNLVYHETGSYMISNATFPSYFLKDSDTVIESHARLDISIFIQIAKALGITCRFVGEEPFSQVTGIYNKIMKQELDHAGIACSIIPRKAVGEEIISASKVRLMLRDSDWPSLRLAVPEITLQFFLSDEAEPILDKIRQSEQIVHY